MIQGKKTKDTTALKILGATAVADGRFPAATANAAATLDPALLAFVLDFAAGSCTNEHGSLLQVPLW